MPFGTVSGVGRGMGVLDGGCDRRTGSGSFGVNLGRPVLTNGTLLHSCAEVRAAIELSFGEVIGVTPGIHVLDAGPRAPKGRGNSGGFFGICAPHWF